MKSRVVFQLLIVCISFFAYSQDGSDISFVNIGKMNIANNGFSEPVSSLYIPDGMQVTTNETDIVVNGILTIGKNFYQDSPTNVFSESGGKVTFNGGKQYITSSYIDGFARGNYYIDFPVINIENNSVVKVASQMGIDVLNITRPASENPSADNGVLYLESTPAANGDNNTFVHNASLRVKNNRSLEAGIVVVEYHVECFRTDSQQTCAFFPLPPLLKVHSGLPILQETGCVLPRYMKTLIIFTIPGPMPMNRHPEVLLLTVNNM